MAYKFIMHNRVLRIAIASLYSGSNNCAFDRPISPFLCNIRVDSIIVSLSTTAGRASAKILVILGDKFVGESRFEGLGLADSFGLIIGVFLAELDEPFEGKATFSVVLRTRPMRHPWT